MSTHVYFIFIIIFFFKNGLNKFKIYVLHLFNIDTNINKINLLTC